MTAFSVQAYIKTITLCLLLVSALTLPAGEADRQYDIYRRTFNTISSLTDFLQGKTRVFHKGKPLHDNFFALTGVVTYASQNRSLVLEDKTGRIILHGIPGTMPVLGDIIAANGLASDSNAPEPFMSCYSIKVIGHTTDSPNIMPVNLEKLIRPSPDLVLRVISTEALLIDVFQDEISPDCDYLLLKDGSALVVATCNHNSSLKNLVNARVSITGLFDKSVNGHRKFTGPCIF